MDHKPSRVDEREAQENRPLLGGDNTDVPQVMSRHHKYLFNGITASLGIGIGILCFLFPVTALGAEGDRFDYRYRDMGLDGTNASVLTASFIVIPMHIVNLILLKRTSKPLPVLLNTLYFGLSGYFSYFGSFSILMNYAFCRSRYCDRSDPAWLEPTWLRDAELKVPEWTPDKVEDCHRWAAKYGAVSIVFLVLLALYGIVQMALFIFVLVEMFDTQRNKDTSERSDASDTRWSLPVGQFSVELSFRWGKPHTEAPKGQPETTEGTRGQE